MAARYLRRHPFLCLGLLTMAIGALWHAPLLPVDLRVATMPVVKVIGAPFIGGMRLSRSLVGASALTPVIGTALGLAPYLIADWLLAWNRRRLRPA
jgi:hypothetical protein